MSKARILTGCALLMVLLFALAAAAFPPKEDCFTSGEECVPIYTYCVITYHGVPVWPGRAEKCIVEYYCAIYGYYWEPCGLCDCIPR